MHDTLRTGLIALCSLALPALAQQAPTGSVVTTNEPGRVAIAGHVKVSALVVAIDPPTRTLTLRGPDGEIFTVVADSDVKNFAQIEVRDQVLVEYLRALELEVRKTSGVRERSEVKDASSAKSGDKPAVAAGRQVRIVADVVDVNPGKRTITLKGPNDKTVELEVRNPEHFKAVQTGNQVEAIYTEALAISVAPAAVKGAKK